MNTCRSCGAPIRWITTEHGRKMPVDEEPMQGIEEPRGAYTVFLDSGACTRIRRFLPGEPRYEQITVEGRQSHFATCPESKTWRKGRW